MPYCRPVQFRSRAHAPQAQIWQAEARTSAVIVSITLALVPVLASSTKGGMASANKGLYGVLKQRTFRDRDKGKEKESERLIISGFYGSDTGKGPGRAEAPSRFEGR